VPGISEKAVELLAEKPTCPTKRNPSSPHVRTCIVNSILWDNLTTKMASNQELLDTQKAIHQQCIRDLMAQLEQEKAEAEAAAAAEAKAAAEAEAEKQRQEVERKAKAEANAKQAEADKKARAETRKGKRKAEDPPEELGSAKSPKGGPCVQCVSSGKTCVRQGGRRATACKRCAKAKGTCSFTKKETGPEPMADSDIEIIDQPTKGSNAVRPTKGPVSIDIPVKSRPSGSRSGGTDLSKVVASIRSLTEVGRGIQKELRGQQLAVEEQVIELRKQSKTMSKFSEALCDLAVVIYQWLHPPEPESGSKEEKDKGGDEEGNPESVTESDTGSESGKVVEKEVEEEEGEESGQEPEPEKEQEEESEKPEEGPAAEVEETMDTSQ
jgi:hypothetical protein